MEVNLNREELITMISEEKEGLCDFLIEVGDPFIDHYNFLRLKLRGFER